MPVSGRPESPLAVADVVLVDGAAAALAPARRQRAGAWSASPISPRPPKGSCRYRELEAVQRADRRAAGAPRGSVSTTSGSACTIPTGVVPELTRTCDCRKPAPGMLLAAARALRPGSFGVVDDRRHRFRRARGAMPRAVARSWWSTPAAHTSAPAARGAGRLRRRPGRGGRRSSSGRRSRLAACSTT